MKSSFTSYFTIDKTVSSGDSETGVKIHKETLANGEIDKNSFKKIIASKLFYTNEK
ncbi:MAG: hypothetical protein K8S56_07730 [Candidatus Cloacimonetes bacterium]|nr:hypothetical protein [Candidatus Cloacimonadota bacterium]